MKHTLLTPESLLKQLDALGFNTKTYHHKAVFTVEDAYDIDLPRTGDCKSLFLKSTKDELFLVVARADCQVNMKWLQKSLNCKRLSFGSPELLHERLGVSPGSVTPFALANDRKHQSVKVILDHRVANSKHLLHFHPLINTMTTLISASNLLSFITWTGHTPYIANFELLTLTAPCAP